MIRIITCIGLLVFVILSGCSDETKPADETPEATSSGAGAASGSSDKKERASIKVVLTGGELAGTYNATCRDACCSYGIAEKTTFGNQYSETGKGEKDLSSVQLIVDDVTGDKSTGEFLVTVTIGDFLNPKSTSYTIDTRKKADDKKGTGNIDLKYSNNKATVKLVGKTEDGVGIELDMECFRVITPTTLTEE
jgi:hypothetical protein